MTAPAEGPLPQPGNNRVPVPDPTALTTQQLERETGSLRALIEARLAAIEHRINHGKELIEAVPTRINEEIDHLLRLISEKFIGVTTQFAERDARIKQTSEDGKTAISAALQAQKEAAGEQNKAFAAATAKSESAFAKQIDQLAATFAAQTKAADDKIDDLKSRLNIIEGSKTGILQVVGVIASIGALLGVAIAVLKSG